MNIEKLIEHYENLAQYGADQMAAETAETLRLYLNALDLLSMRTNMLDRVDNIYCVWSAEKWKQWALDSAKKKRKD